VSNENFPIFRSALELCIYMETIVKGFDKYHKYTIGEDMRKFSKDLLFIINRGGLAKDKVRVLTKLREVFAADFRDRVVHYILVRELEKIYEPKFINDFYNNLCNKIIYHNPTKNYVFKGDKTLFKIPSHKGLAIGNLTSQFFANVYMNRFDNYVKIVLKMKYYIRYVDDFILFHKSKEKLQEVYTQTNTKDKKEK